MIANDPAVRANVVAAFSGNAAPAGIRSCIERGDVVAISFDDAITPVAVVDDAVTIATHFVPELETVGAEDEESASRLRARLLVGLE